MMTPTAARGPKAVLIAFLVGLAGCSSPPPPQEQLGPNQTLLRKLATHCTETEAELEVVAQRIMAEQSTKMLFVLSGMLAAVDDLSEVECAPRFVNLSIESPITSSASPRAPSPNATVLSKLDAQCSESSTKISEQADFVRNALRDDFGKTFSKDEILTAMQKATSSLTGNRECADVFATLIVMLGQQ